MSEALGSLLSSTVSKSMKRISAWYNTIMKLTKDGRPDKRYKEAQEIEQQTPQEEPKNDVELTAQELLMNFLIENDITLDYSIVEERLLNTGDGFVLTPKKPLIKVSARYNND